MRDWQRLAGLVQDAACSGEAISKRFAFSPTPPDRATAIRAPNPFHAPSMDGPHPARAFFNVRTRVGCCHLFGLLAQPEDCWP